MDFLKKRIKLKKLKSLRKKINWAIEQDRHEFLRQLDPLIGDWFNRLPDLGNIFRKEEIDCLLSDCINYRPEDRVHYQGQRFIEFVIRIGYKDVPDVDNDDKPSLRRTTPVHQAAKHKNLRLVRLLFEIYDRFDLNYTDDSGRTHFHVACEYGCEDVVEKFLELGQDPDCLVPETGDSPLHLALRRGHKKVAELLLRSCADPNLSNGEGSTPLHTICKRYIYDTDMAEMLFRVGKEKNQQLQVDAQDKLGNTPLHLALTNCNVDLVEWLLRNSADPNVANQDGLTPLHVICKRNDDDGLAEKFLEIIDDIQLTAVQVDARDKLDRTPLQWAVANCLPHVVDMLLDRGADLSSFVFPSASYFGECFEVWLDVDMFKLRLASGALGVVESLEKRGYELSRSDALTIVKFFAKYRLFEKSSNSDATYWYDDDEFAREATNIILSPSLSLYELIQLRPDEAEKRLAYADYSKFWSMSEMWDLPEEAAEACELHLCEILSRGFFRYWALDFFWELTREKLPILCCEMIMKRLTNQDLCHICLAAASL